ncbi:3'(2'),5'-bisphosphate nucleotidase CysQ [Caulobacter sp. 17J80-11]|uniref:3'(2'),5'-bisphosphate nucleotidase CysQ n=1 Tax=Caulobacter sp. 17J80-11 TaxID=2763502 RepID=UPI001653D988|nr:3'(2'),5'-bisphosphate nucleotidase CysQ [Caulobacter sp. 17J80-11]MBC6981039.1 3'(2'),5'-bisphosphate nucleotidase CysQ [Caulobacter sp. 17J80-11]
MTDDLVLLRDAALEAGRIAREHRERGLKIWSKSGGSPVTDADLAVDKRLHDILLAARPDYGWLSEETADDPARLSRRRLFVVDPIDGTVAFMKGKPWWTVALAVVEDEQPVAAVVYAPALDELYEAAAGQGARRNGQPIRASDADSLEDAAMLADAKLFERDIWADPWPAMRFEKRNSIAYRMALVAAGAFDAAVALSPKHDWDVAAGALIAAEAGAITTDHRGRPFRFNQPVPAQPSLVCAAPGVHPLILSRCAPISLPE